MILAGRAVISDVDISQVKNFPSPEADLAVFEEGGNVPFAVRRVFTVHAHEPAGRGRHAHRECNQYMICLAGACKITVDDGSSRRSITLSSPDQALYMPASIWGEQNYLEAGTILMVLCDRNYDEADYIRDYDAFLAYRSVDAEKNQENREEI